MICFGIYMAWVAVACIVSVMSTLHKWGFNDNSSNYSIFIIIRIYDME